MRAHGGADHLGRQVEEGRVHIAQHRDRPFGEAGDLLQQPLVLHQLDALGGADGAGAVEDDPLAVDLVENDEVVEKGGLVLVEVGDFDRSMCEIPRGAHEAVPLGQIARLYPSISNGTT